MESSEATRLLRLSQDSNRLTPDERQAVRACLREVFSRPGKRWSAGEREQVILWLCEAVNRRRTIGVVQRKIRTTLRLNVELGWEVAQDGFDEAKVKFIERLHLKYDPERYPYYEKEALLTSYFRTAVLNVTLPVVVRRLGQPFDSIDDVDPIEDQSTPPPGAGLDARRYLEAMTDLINQTLAVPQAGQALAMRRAGLKAQEVALRFGLPKSLVADLRHAQVFKCLLEDVQGRPDWPGGEGVATSVHAVIAETLGLPQHQVKVAVLRAKEWLYGKLGQPFPEPEHSDGEA